MSSSSNEVLAHQNSSNAGPTTMRRRFDTRGFSNRTGDFHQERNRYAPYQKRDRSQTQSRGSNNMSRVCNNYGDVIHSNSINNRFPCNNYQKPFVAYANPNPQLVPLPLPYRKLDAFDSLPERSPIQSFPVISSSFVTGVRFNPLPNYPNSMPMNHSTVPHSMPMNHSIVPNSVPMNHSIVPNSMPMNHSIVPHSMPMNHSVVPQAVPQQPIVTKELSDLPTLLNNNKEKPNSTPTPEPEPTLSLSFDSLCVRRESVIKSLYSDMPRQCSSCGVRFKCQEDHSNHMDWHVRKNRVAKQANRTNARLSHKPKQSRSWLANSSLWLLAATSGTTKPTFEATQEAEVAKQQHVVSADENQTMCALCLEPFENFFSDEADDWLYKDTVYLHHLGPIVHVKCMPEPRKRPSKIMSVTTVPTALVC